LLDDGWALPDDDGPTAWRRWNCRVNSCPYARPERDALAPPFRTQELAVLGGGRRGARSRLLAAARGLHDGRADPARSGLLRFLPGRTRPVTPAARGANSSAVQSACLTRRKSGVRIPLRPLVYQIAT